MPRLVVELPPVAWDDLRRLADRLREADVFTPSFVADDVDVYDPQLYRREAALHGTTTVLRLDRNVVTRWVGLARGDAPTPEHRLAAAVLAFAQCAEIDVEPNLTLYELAAADGVPGAVRELELVRLADHVHPACWADVALGRADRVPEDGLSRAAALARRRRRGGSVNFAMPLRQWRRNYVLCLRIAALELAGGDPEERMRRLIDWAFREFQFKAPSLMLASLYFAPNAPRKRLFKQLRSTDRGRALAGVRNAAWDAALVAEFLEDVGRQPAARRLALLTTFDAGVQRLARAVTDDRADAGDSPLHLVLRRYWGPAAGERLARQLDAYAATLDAPERRVNQAVDRDFVDAHIARGEAELLGWSPTR